MPKFKVLVQQYVEQICEIVLDAEDADAARVQALDWNRHLATAKWIEGDDAQRADAYAVYDADGEMVWER